MNSGDIIAKPVMTIRPGRIIGKIRYPIVNANRQEVVGFIVDDDKWLTDTKVLLFPLVRSMDKDAVTVEDGSSIIPISNLKAIQRQLEENIQPIGHKVITETGVILGFIEEFSFHHTTGKIDAYKVKNSNTYVSYKDILSTGKYLIVVREHIPGAVEKPLPLQTQNRFDDSYDLNSLFERRQMEFALGKRLLRNVATEDGHVIAYEGEVIDEDTIYRAKKQNRFTELVMSIDSFDSSQ